MTKATRYNEVQLRTLLRKKVQEAGSQVKFAKRYDLRSRPHVTDVLNGRRNVRGRLLEIVGVRKVVTFEAMEKINGKR